MKYMFASDVHGSAYYCRKMLEAYDAEKAERLVLLGALDFSLHAFRLRADYFLLEPVSEEAFRRGLNAWIE